jgi:hypothetical protein
MNQDAWRKTILSARIKAIETNSNQDWEEWHQTCQRYQAFLREHNYTPSGKAGNPYRIV